MTTELAVIRDPETVDKALAWLQGLPQLPVTSMPSDEALDNALARLMAPADEVWILARVAALLVAFYERDTPQSVREMEARDWLAELAGYPEWAIERACRWWKSAANPDRRKRPLEGDISARCKVEIRGVHVVPDLIKRKRAGQVFTREDRDKRRGVVITQEQSEAILRAAGFAVHSARR